MADLELPGFRFHPTEEELLNFYLKKVVFGHKLHFDIIGFLNIYRHDPWELPGLAKIGEREWYFYVPRDRKQGPSGAGRPNRTTLNGFWKATGSDRTIRCLTDPKKILGLRKTLVFYNGRAPRGSKTDWVMNEYRLMPQNSVAINTSPEDIVLCKIYRKATSLKVLEQRAAMEEEEMERAAMEEEEMFKSSSSSPEDSFMSASLMESEINIFCNSVTNEEVQECELEQEQEQEQAPQEQEPIKEEHVEDVQEVALVKK
ncbi:hypothetical protein MKW94_011983 [Papaver nudicaule]|uniref:NAC domain-containing protein n=1 Tax=Papaver nudicaule TaxID=74823 RepID=A0AA41RVY5_PAPNU|nr:hypothetical protein [Papaver nudicaule]